MALNNLADLSTTAASNTDFRGQSVAGSAGINTIDTMLQNLGSMLARFYDDVGATGTVAGSADAITLTTTSSFQSLANGLFTSFKAAAANTGAATLNVDALGAKAIRRQGDSALEANDMVAGGIYLVRYDTSYNAAAGAWVLLNPAAATISAASTTEVLTGTDASKYATPDSLAALWEKGADVASASTISLGEGGYFHITGTTTITDIDFATPADGRMAMLVFDGALTLTHNATTLVLPSGANITTAAGDSAIIVQDSGDNIKVVAYQRASGAPVGGDTVTLLGTLTTTSGSSQTLSGLTLTNYKFLRAVFNGVSGQYGVRDITLNSVVVVSTADSGNRVYGIVEVDLATGVMTSNLSLSSGGATAGVASTSTLTTASTSVVVAYSSSGSFDAGSVRIYGIR